MSTPPADVRVVQALDFGAVPVGSSLELDLELVNGSRSAAELTLITALPFRLLAPTATLPAGGQTRVRVIFEPAALGPSAGALELRTSADAPALQVALSGVGVAPCEAAQCHEVHFDPYSRSCVEVASADGTSCAEACLVAPTCLGGTCIGPGRDCDDLDPCTAVSAAGDLTCALTVARNIRCWGGFGSSFCAGGRTSSVWLGSPFSARRRRLC